jgi:transposase
VALTPNEQLDLALPEQLVEAVVINGRCLLRREGRIRMVSVAGLPVYQWTEGDTAAEAYAKVSLVRCGYADQTEVARAFGCSTRTLRRQERRFERLGMEGLGRGRGRPMGTVGQANAWVQTAGMLRKQGAAVRTIAERLRVSVGAVSKWLGRFQRPPSSTAPSASAPPGKTSSVRLAAPEALTVPPDRTLDRLFARLGHLQDAEPIFVSGRRIARAGVLLAIPALLQSGVFSAAEKVYGSIGPAFYGLRTTMTALLFMALLRIKRPEALKEYLPEELGRILGLDRTPEVKTLRRKLQRLAAAGKARLFGQELAERRVKTHGAMLGFLYIDGHVRVYHGKRKLAKAYATRMRLALPATTDYWVNDKGGDPVFVVTAELNESLTGMLPKLLEEIRRLVGKRRVTIVFDRGGWSPKLFVKLIDQGFDMLTYRKGPWRDLSERQFKLYTRKIDGREVSYRLNDHNIRLLGGRLHLRQVTRLSDGGHQTPIVTSRRDLSALTLAYRMFERWRQENFFKYLREEYALDALLDYQAEPENPQATVPNPERRKLAGHLRGLRARIRRLELRFGQIVMDKRLNRSARSEKKTIRKQIRRLHERVRRARKKYPAVSARVLVKDLPGEPLLRLARERQHLAQCLKMVAYQAESDLLALVRPHYARADQEGRTLITSALQSAADLQVGKNQLTVRLAPLSSAHRSHAIAALCQALNRMNVRFPGTSLRMRYAVSQEAV